MMERGRELVRETAVDVRLEVRGDEVVLSRTCGSFDLHLDPDQAEELGCSFLKAARAARGPR